MRYCSPLLLLLSAALPAAEPETLDPVVVMSQRREARQPVLHEWDQAEIARAAPRTLDELLASEPSFSLYRRQSALFGNPTTAGVSLRNTGASAASRTLVLLDGIPQNDPFGGWVYWGRYDAGQTGAVRIVPAAQSVVWGNQSPAGVVQIDSPDPFVRAHTLRMGVGSHQTWSYSTHNRMVADDGSVAVGVSAFALHSGGFPGVAAAQRGPVDRPLSLDARGADLRFAWKAASDLVVEPSVSWYEEERGNGTPLTGNSTEAVDLSLRVTSNTRPLGWQALWYYQQRDFGSAFSSVNATRTAETPSLDQFSVPGQGTGGAFLLHWQPEGRWSLNAGADFRWLEGATHEDATFLAGSFTRRRHAGGEQSGAGVFAAAGYRPDAASRVDLSLRADWWQQQDGHRFERSLVNGLPLRQERSRDREDWEPSLSLAYTRDLTADLQFSISAGTAFRLPNLNELYRPYRVKNDIIEANPALEPERFYSMETGLQWQIAAPVRVEASLFHHTIDDAIANVPVTDPAEIAAIFGTIPPGGSGAQRRNVNQAQVSGLQGALVWTPQDTLEIRFDGIWSETRFSQASVQPLLEGRAFPQAPDLKLSGNITWQATESISLTAGAEYGGRQFDDALAQRRIPSYWTARVGGVWELADGLTTFARMENLFDAEVATGLASDGTRSIAGPRAIWTGLEWRF